jgi:selenocysteine lyase/cysteine desulfurase
LDVNDVARVLRPNTRLLVTTHGSNVIGTLMPVGALARLAREQRIAYLVDASQTAGVIPIDVQDVEMDLLAFSGHKGLLGPTGTGGLYIREGVVLAPLIRGGTGSDSAHEIQPDFLPDAYESGTLNVAGIAGLAAGVGFLSEIGIEAVKVHEQTLVAQFLAGASEVPGITLYGPRDAALQCGVVSFNVAGAMPSEVALILDESFEIMARSGLHCAPAAHRTLDTFPAGTVRFSFGWFNTAAEVHRALVALREVALWAAESREVANTWTA